MNRIDLGYRSRLPTRLPKFEYLEARTIEEACSLCAQYKGKAKVIAGGTDLMVLMRNQAVKPEYIINMKTISNLNYIRSNGGGLRVGALATMNDIENSSLLREKLPALADTAHCVGSPQVRNAATIGGNLCNASPAADTAPILIALGAKVKIKSLKGERSIALEEFFTGPGQTVLGDDEILTEIEIPQPAAHTGSVYLKLPARTAIDLAVVGVAAVVTLNSQGKDIVDAKIGLGAVAPTPIRARSAEGVIKGGAVSDELIGRAAQAAAGEAKPISDIRGSASYRKEIVKVLTNRAIRQAVNLAK